MGRIGAVLAVMLGMAGAAQAEAPAEPPKARVETGVLVGEATDRAEIFRNIPYAAPPVGALRWRPPAPALAWMGERAAVEKGPACPQPMNADGTPNFGSANGPINEDCLQLNVFAPKAGTRKGPAPVMVWLHGGGNTTGAGWIYDGQAFARDGIVLVTLNYRLGALGWLAHPALSREAGTEPAANFGLMDQIAALEWVKRNIAAFGGDPSNVTLFGQSAGASDTLVLLTTPKAWPLFHKAIVQSGGGWAKGKTLAESEQDGGAFVQGLGLPGADATAAELRALPAEALVSQPFRGGLFGPVLDGKLVTRSALDAFAAGKAADVPLVIGANSGEESVMGLWRTSPQRVQALADPAVQRAYAGDAEAAGREIFGDLTMVAPARWIAAKASGGQPAWLYHFSYIGARFRPQGMTRAAHSAEIQYVFEYWGRRTPLSAVSEDDRAMAALTHGCWVAFARSGRPDCPSGEAWPAYKPRSDRLMEFGQASGVRQGFRKEQLDATEAVALRRLASQN